jgi:hypothetical protein
MRWKIGFHLQLSGRVKLSTSTFKNIASLSATNGTAGPCRGAYQLELSQ